MGVSLRMDGTRTSHANNRHRRPPRQHPSQALHFALTITIESHGDLVIQLLDRALHAPLLHPHGHLPVVEHPTQVVFQGKRVLRQFLVQDLDFVLQVGALGAHLFVGAFTGVLDLRAKFGAGGAEEVRFLCK